MIQIPPTTKPPPVQTHLSAPASRPEPAQAVKAELAPQQQDKAKPDNPPAKHRPRNLPAVLRFSPTAWAKLLYFRDRGDTEIGGFGITPADDPLYVADFQTVRQEVTVASVSFDDQGVADFFDRQVDAGREPCQFMRLWLHSHPGNSPQPSMTDEETFHRVFGSCQYALMFIIARDGRTYCRLRFNVGPGGDLLIPVEVDYRKPFPSADRKAWVEEFLANIRPAHHVGGSWLEIGALPDTRPMSPQAPENAVQRVCLAEEVLEQLEAMEPAEREQVLDELAGRPDLWGGEGDFYG